MRRLAYILLAILNPFTVTALIVALVFILKPEGFEALTGIDSRDDSVYTFLGTINSISALICIFIVMYLISPGKIAYILKKYWKKFIIVLVILIIMSQLILLQTERSFKKSQSQAVEATHKANQLIADMEDQLNNNLSGEEKRSIELIKKSKLFYDEEQRELLEDKLIVLSEDQLDRLVQIFIDERNFNGDLFNSVEYRQANEEARTKEEMKKVFEARMNFNNLQKRLFFEIENFEYKDFN